jgi:hypothetical protein
MLHTLILSLLLSSSIVLTNSLAGDRVNLAITDKAKDIKLTIYNNNLAMINEQRRAYIKKSGRVKLMYPGIPSAIDTSSVIAKFKQQVELYSQNYSFDTISYNSLLNYHLGKRVLYTERDDSVEIKEGTLLALSPLLIQEKNYGAIYIPNQLFFPNIPKDMAVKPSLFWNIKTNASRLDIDLTYLTTGMSWSSDYTLNIIDEKRLNLNSWITITNNSGANYKDANITLLAGDVKTPTPTVSLSRVHTKKRDNSKNIKNQSFSGYHIYKIPFKESIKNREKKQISFIEKESINYQRYALNSQQLRVSNLKTKKLRFRQVIVFKNSKNNHLGIPLPKGTIRVYQKDKENSSHFIGSENIKNIPNGKLVKLVIGEQFDIVGKERVVEYQETNRSRHIKYTITISNNSKHKKSIKIKRAIPKTKGEVTIKDSCQNRCTKKSLSALSTLYTIPLKAKESYDLNITYDLEMR